MCPYSELFWSVFSRIWTECREMRSISPYSVRMREMRTRITPNTDAFHAVIYMLQFILYFFPIFTIPYVLNPKSDGFTFFFDSQKAGESRRLACKSGRINFIRFSYKYFLYY